MSEQANNASTLEDLTQASGAPLDVPLLPGRQLAAARQSQGWSVEQVAAQLKLAPRQIEAIEADRLEELPSMTVARGFIGTYARLLKIDSAPLLAAVAADLHSPIESIRKQGHLAAPFSATRLPSMHARAAPNRKGVMLLALALGLAVLIWGVQQADWRAAVPPALLAAVGWQPPAQDAVAGVVGAEAVAASNDVALPSAISPLATPSVIQAVDASTAGAQVAPTSVSALMVESPTVAAPSVAGKNDLLSLVLRQDSWIEIKRADSSVVVSRLARAGTTETFEIVEPVSLVVGNAAGVDATLRNVPLDLKSGASTNVARINLK
ncbi:MAG TPA: RodZ domain-containing protein [Burkholderiaceae bacterium]|nr:RodZ domain-containing protein [Burkholderiaceae bacterium]